MGLQTCRRNIYYSGRSNDGRKEEIYIDEAGSR